VEVRPVDVNASEWDHALEPLMPSSSGEKSRHALRLGFRLVSGFREKDAKAMAEARKEGGPFVSAEDVMRRANLRPSTMLTLARADAFGSLDLDRRKSLWSVSGLESGGLPLFGCDDASAGRAQAGGPIDLPAMRDEQAVTEDYSIFGLSLRNHPMSFARPFLREEGAVTAADLKSLSDGCFVKIAGLVLFRQQPGTAKGTIFMTIEDETGTANLIVWPKIAEKYRRAVFSAKALLCEGVLQKESNVIHVVSRRLIDWTRSLGRLHAEDEALKRDKRTKKRVSSSWTDALKSRDFR
jgi:error-prone DNA polymerase